MRFPCDSCISTVFQILQRNWYTNVQAFSTSRDQTSVGLKFDDPKGHVHTTQFWLQMLLLTTSLKESIPNELLNSDVLNYPEPEREFKY